MTKDKYPLYGLAILTGAAVAFWLGLSPSLLIFLLICPLMMFFMMFFMMRGPRGEHSDNRDQTGPAEPNLRQPVQPGQVPSLDGSHERIDKP